jgi:hypothetical protein
MGGDRFGRFLLVVLLASAFAWTGAARADTRIIDDPTAEPLGRGFLRWEIGAGPEGSVLTSLGVGVLDRLQFGLSYGLQELIGEGDIEFNPRPGVQAQVLVLDAVGLPAVALGFDSQGRGRWLDASDRYERKSLGFYGVASWNLMAGSLFLTSLSAGMNYSMEGARESPDFFAGVAEGIGRHFSLLLDYDFGWDDRGNDQNQGYLDLGLQWRLERGAGVRLLFRDLFENAGPIGRELNFFYLFRM